MIEKLPDDSELIKSKEMEMYLRKQKVWDLTLQGFSQEQIAEKLGVSSKTISRDIKEIKKDSVRWMDNLTRGQIQMYHRSNFETIEKVTKELWQILENTVDEKLKVKILKTIVDNRRLHANMLQHSDLVNLGDSLHDRISPPKTLFESNTFAPQRQEINYDKL